MFFLIKSFGRFLLCNTLLFIHFLQKLIHLKLLFVFCDRKYILGGTKHNWESTLEKILAKDLFTNLLLNIHHTLGLSNYLSICSFIFIRQNKNLGKLKHKLYPSCCSTICNICSAHPPFSSASPEYISIGESCLINLT